VAQKKVGYWVYQSFQSQLPDYLQPQVNESQKLYGVFSGLAASNEIDH